MHRQKGIWVQDNIFSPSLVFSHKMKQAVKLCIILKSQNQLQQVYEYRDRPAVFMMMQYKILKSSFFLIAGSLIICILYTHPLYGQQTNDSLNVRLHEITVTAPPFGLTRETSPIAFTNVERSNLEVQSDPALSFDRITTTIPGLWVNNRGDFSLGERVTLRGLGWRSAFGVRGIQVFLDNISLTTADGQSEMSIVDPAFIRQINVIRGPASAFWGNSSGGILYLSTLPKGRLPSEIRIRQTFGSYGLAKTGFQITGNTHTHKYQFYSSYLSEQGFRNYSAVHLFRAGFADQFRLGATGKLGIDGAFVAMPKAEHPGSLTKEQAEENPRQAQPRYENAGAGKQVYQGQLGGTLRELTSAGRFRATLYGLFRNLNNPLPFAWIRVNRLAGGTRLALENQTGPFQWGAGYEGKWQRDHRFNWQDQGGGTPTPADEMTIDQMERVINHAFFGEGTITLSSLTISAGIRYDRLLFKNDDYLQPLAGHTSQAGRRLFHAWSPSVGAAYHTGFGEIYADFRTAFEAPTTTELVNRPGGGRGFNPDIQPEHIEEWEAGIRGDHLLSKELSYDIALFRLRVHDMLVPYQGTNGRTYYNNQGKTRHWGIEAQADWKPAPRWEAVLTWQYLKAVFLSGFNSGSSPIRGNSIPGLPLNRGSVRISYSGKGWSASTDAELVSSYFVNDANTMQNGSSLVWNLRLGLQKWQPVRDITLVPYIEGYNLLNSRYNGSVQINATNGQYFEPAPGRHWAAGVSVTFR